MQSIRTTNLVSINSLSLHATELMWGTMRLCFSPSKNWSCDHHQHPSRKNGNLSHTGPYIFQTIRYRRILYSSFLGEGVGDWFLWSGKYGNSKCAKNKASPFCQHVLWSPDTFFFLTACTFSVTITSNCPSTATMYKNGSMRLL